MLVAALGATPAHAQRPQDLGEFRARIRELTSKPPGGGAEAQGAPQAETPKPPSTELDDRSVATPAFDPGKGDAVRWPYYDRGFVLVPTPDPVKQPFRLRLNHVSQFRYTNTLAVREFYTTHLGERREVLRRNDVQLTRDVFYFTGFVFTPKLDFNILLYTSSATLSATAAGYVGYVFNKAFALRVGFFSLPSVRSLTGTYPFFHSTDRSMANNYVRPGFTQGVWANGELLPGFNYIAMVGNSLNTLDLAAATIDQNFAVSSSIWYDLNEFGKEWNDWEVHTRPALRVGTAFTFAPEDRLSNLSQASPENNSIFITDGTLLFETGALAPGVTISLANFYLWAIDGGFKYRGLAFNLEFYMRWLNQFEADGPVPEDSLFDWGAEASLGYFFVRGVLEVYARTSFIRGPFGDPIEGGGGYNWYPFGTRHVWLNVECLGISRSPYQSVLYAYSSGQTGMLFQSQFLLRF
jgi:hypothetical protein